MQSLVNVPLSVPVNGSTPFSSYGFFINGVAQQLVGTTSAISSGLQTLTVTPTGTGELFVTDPVLSKIYGPFHIVTALTQTQIQTLIDGVLGSWQWNKVSGVLTFYAQNGSVLQTFTFQDSPTSSSRQLSVP